MTSDVIGEFIVQLPPGLYLAVCAPFFILVAYFMVALYARSQRAKRKIAAQAMQASNQGGSDALEMLQAVRREYSAEEMPELDVLLEADDERAEAQPASNQGVRTLNRKPQPVRLHNGELSEAREVLTVLRSEVDGRLMVQMGELAYRTLAESPETKRVFNKLMKELGAVIMRPDAAPEAQQPDSAVTMPEGLETAMDADEAEIGSHYRTVPPPPQTPDGRMPGDLPSYRFDDNPTKIENRGLRRRVEFDAPPELDIATAIETYLQYRIQHTPEFRNRDIHVLPALTGGVRIQVDDQYYEAVDEIADPETRAFVKTVIAEWQERQ
jgi:hypothetical protein